MSELRTRLVITLAAVAVAFGFAFWQNHALVNVPEPPPSACECRGAHARQPVTLGLGEPFTQAPIIAGYFALLLTLPVILWQLYAFVIPAFSPGERRVALPLMATAPLLYVRWQRPSRPTTAARACGHDPYGSIGDQQ